MNLSAVAVAEPFYNLAYDDCYSGKIPGKNANHKGLHSSLNRLSTHEAAQAEKQITIFPGVQRLKATRETELSMDYISLMFYILLKGTVD